jgi:hypothetical protein
MLRLGLDRQLALLAGCGGGCYLDRFGAGVVVPLDVTSVVDQPAAVPWVHSDRIGLAHLFCPLLSGLRIPLDNEGERRRVTALLGRLYRHVAWIAPNT